MTRHLVLWLGGLTCAGCGPGDFEATLEIGGACNRSFTAGADIDDYGSGALVTFYTAIDPLDGCIDDFEWEWAAAGGALEAFSANECLLGEDIRLDAGATFSSSGDGYRASGSRGVIEDLSSGATLCEGPFTVTFEPR
jgi:hypothetical protein